MMRKICYITGTRADFGLMQSTLELIDKAPGLELSLIVTGMHLLEEYGSTIQDIEAAGFKIAATVAVGAHSSGAAMGRNIGIMISGFIDALESARPDVVMLLGDRGEMLAGAIAAIHLNIPIVHVHGGERSGTVDEPVRHAISKLSHLHFTATTDARERLIRMGENPADVYVTGAPGLDGLTDMAKATRTELLESAGLDPARPFALMVYHPVLQEAEAAGTAAESILAAMAAGGVQIVALKPNSDAGSDGIRKVLEQHASDANLRVFTHFPRTRFVAWMAAAEVMVGNSSAGIIEAASFGTPVINIGSRQHLRERNANTVDVPTDETAISAALVHALHQGRRPLQNVYGDGSAGLRILQLLSETDLNAAMLAKSNAY
ncbi:UDP-N-acetylglucosamine 2-epimerase [Herbaspirillum sp. NPDC101396]|uniref:UDP-N-acetylglucosamine 2-epimerase n=1 Tax=Herbaspirillum sp. NPDC101396 TaxID=3364005 RepID=UPI00383B2EB0